ncbi:MAG TPA: glycosyltransferase family 4 protein [Terriglobia bacterium]|nr:glycosyltransferase family 4 protein [Terriglobia bacterium]
MNNLKIQSPETRHPTSQISICIIVENLPVPFDRRIWQEASALRDAGYGVSIICPKGKGFEKSRETLEGIEIYRHKIWEASGLVGYLAEYTWALAVEFFLAVHIYRKTRFRILQAANPPDTIFLIGLAFKFLGVRFIFDHHDLNPELFEAKFKKHGLFYRLVCLAERWSFRTASVSIATNESYREIARARGGMSPERVFVVRSLPDLNHIQRVAPRNELKEGKAHLVAYVGVMGFQDGLDLLLESVEYIVKTRNRRDVFFVMIGSGTESPRLRALSTQKGLDEWVRFTGRISADELAAYLCTADVCVAPDPANPMNDKSTMNKILQYMAFGRPVVLYDLTEGRRSAGDTALYARPNDPADFAAQILNLLDSEPLRRDLGERARKRIEEKLDWQTEKKTLLAAYETALR